MHKNSLQIAILILCLGAIVSAGCGSNSVISGQPPASQAPKPCISPCVAAEFQIPTTSSDTTDITAGPDGSLWFTETGGGHIGKMTPSGKFSEYGVPSGGNAFGIVVGPDRNLWFGQVICPSCLYGTIDELTTATGKASQILSGQGYGCAAGPALGCTLFGGLTSGPDGNLWVTSSIGSKFPCKLSCPNYSHTDEVLVMTVGGIITARYAIDSVGGYPFFDGLGAIIVGPDRNLWFTEMRANKIGRINISGALTEYPIPTSSSGLGKNLTTGWDGNIWFVESTANKVGKITPSGVITEYSVTTASSGPLGITSGPDGNIWFTENTVNQIGRITPSGSITEYPIPTPSSGPDGITAGTDGNLWFVENKANQIAKFRL